MGDKSCTIGLDIGTTSIKVVAYAPDATQLAMSSARVQMQRDEDGSAVQDPELIYQSVMNALENVVISTKQAGYQIAAVGFSTAMHSIIPIGEDEEFCGQAMTWLDSRSHQEAQDLWESDLGKDIYHHTGTPIHAMAPITKIAWLKGQHSDKFSKMRRFASIKEFIWHRWFKVWEVDFAMASATGMFDIEKYEWYPAALKYAGIDSQSLSKPVSTTHYRHPVEGDELTGLGFSTDTGFCIGGSDGVLASLAAGAIDKDTMVFTVGTSLALRTGFSSPKVDADTRSFCYILDDKHYIVGAPSNSGGVVLDWLYRNILTEHGEEFESRFPRLCRAAGKENIEDLICIPYVAGERAPLWDEHATASFIGLQMHHNQAAMMRAAIEAVIFNAYWIGERLMGGIGQPKRIVASGKMFMEDWVPQLAADLFDIEFVLEDDFDGATLGAVTVANQALGLPPIRRKGKAKQVVLQPRKEQTAILRAKFSKYKQLCHQLLGASLK